MTLHKKMNKLQKPSTGDESPCHWHSDTMTVNIQENDHGTKWWIITVAWLSDGMTGHLKQSYYFRIFTVEIDDLHVMLYKGELGNSAYLPSGINSLDVEKKETDSKMVWFQRKWSNSIHAVHFWTWVLENYIDCIFLFSFWFKNIARV